MNVSQIDSSMAIESKNSQKSKSQSGRGGPLFGIEQTNTSRRKSIEVVSTSRSKLEPP